VHGKDEGAKGVPVKGAGEHEEIIARELVHARVELAVVDQTACFADYEECEDDPVANEKRKTQRRCWALHGGSVLCAAASCSVAAVKDGVAGGWVVGVRGWWAGYCIDDPSGPRGESCLAVVRRLSGFIEMRRTGVVLMTPKRAGPGARV
jgi:hypothetical protein